MIRRPSPRAALPAAVLLALLAAPGAGAGGTPLSALVGAATRTASVVATSGGALSYRKVFRVTACARGGAGGVTLAATDGTGYWLHVEAARLPGRLRIDGGADPGSTFLIRGTVAGVAFAGAGAARKVTVTGAFLPGGVPGSFTLTATCG